MLQPANVALSVVHYVNNVTTHLDPDHIEVLPFNEQDPLPSDVDLYWDPRAGQRGLHPNLLHTNKPCVVTFHGAAFMTLPITEFSGRQKRRWAGYWRNRIRATYEWRRSHQHYTRIIAVSNYAKQEVVNSFGVDSQRVSVIYHGIDHDLFKPDFANLPPEPYLLHVSQFKPVKNIDRLIAAYNLLENPAPRLRIVVPGYPDRQSNKNIDLIRTPLRHAELAALYQGAIGFVFPSLRETFGFPIVEAMACGCPVITANTTACAEVAGDAAFLVDPRSVPDIASAIQRLIVDPALQSTLRKKGIQQAAMFNWKTCAEQHYQAFQEVVD